MPLKADPPARIGGSPSSGLISVASGQVQDVGERQQLVVLDLAYAGLDLRHDVVLERRTDVYADVLETHRESLGAKLARAGFGA